MEVTPHTPAQCRASSSQHGSSLLSRTRSKSICPRDTQRLRLFGATLSLPAALPARSVLISTWLAAPRAPLVSVPRPSHNRPCVRVTAVMSSLQSYCGSCGLLRPAVAPCQPPPSASWGSRAAESRPQLPALKAAVVGVLPLPRLGKASRPRCLPRAPREDGASPRGRQAPSPRLSATMPPILYTLINFCLTDLLGKKKDELTSCSELSYWNSKPLIPFLRASKPRRGCSRAGNQISTLFQWLEAQGQSLGDSDRQCPAHPLPAAALHRQRVCWL